MSSEFILNPRFQEYAAAVAEICVDTFQAKFGMLPDYTEAFVPELERALNLFWSQMQGATVPQDAVESFASLFGTYLGETLRRNYAAEWGNCDGMPALKFSSGLVCFPGKVIVDRLTRGPEYDVYLWYLDMVRQGSTAAPA